MTLTLWRLLRDVYTYEGACIWWRARNRRFGGQRPCDSDIAEVKLVLYSLSAGAM